MKIIHTSDWHLGARLHEEDRAPEHDVFLDWLLDLLSAEKPDALVVAGDVFDVKAPSSAAQKQYYGFLAKAVKGGCCGRIVVAAGNHDSAAFLAAPSSLLDGLGVSVVSGGGADSGDGGTVVVPGKSGVPALAVAAMPFMYDAELANCGAAAAGEGSSREERIAAGWRLRCAAAISAARAAARGAPVVAAAHCTLAGAELSDAVSERSRGVIGGIGAFDPAPLAAADYVALGHLHKPQPVKGFKDTMFYSGSPLKMGFAETRCAKSVNIVECGAPGEKPSVRMAPVPPGVPLADLSGTPGAVDAELAALVLASAPRVFARISIDGFDGPSRPHWERFRSTAAGAGIRILEERDVRPASGASGLAELARRGVDSVSPRELAERKLRASSAHYGEEQMAELMRMFDAVAAQAAEEAAP